MKKIVFLILFSFFLSSCVTTTIRDEITLDATSEDLSYFQGRWVVIHNELRKNVLEKMHGSYFIFDDNQFHIEGDTGTETFRIDNSSNPKRIDFINGDSIIKGIYSTDGDLLIICTAPPGKARPTKLETKTFSGNILTKIKRAN